MSKRNPNKKSLWAEFKEFINKGNAMALAVGTIIGGAFSNIPQIYFHIPVNTQHRLEGNKPLLTVCWEGHVRLRHPSSRSQVPKASMEVSQDHVPSAPLMVQPLPEGEAGIRESHQH